MKKIIFKFCGKPADLAKETERQLKKETIMNTLTLGDAYDNPQLYQDWLELLKEYEQ